MLRSQKKEKKIKIIPMNNIQQGEGISMMSCLLYMTFDHPWGYNIPGVFIIGCGRSRIKSNCSYWMGYFSTRLAVYRSLPLPALWRIGQHTLMAVSTVLIQCLNMKYLYEKVDTPIPNKGVIKIHNFLV